ncbi:MAG: GTPase HflX [Bacteriovoracaceae bacterium]|nr:GTPase HflX [Bacteriovoracaceae bacterium]
MNFDEFKITTEYKATLVSIVTPKLDGHTDMGETKASLAELRELLRTLGLEAGQEFVQNKKDIDPATVLGHGKIEEIAEAAKADGSKLLVFDFELKPSQVRNIREITGLEVADRVNIILEIFAQHAHTRDAKIQIEISRLEYLAPRLSTLWTHLSRQKGSTGVRSGEGELQIELDRRMVREKIELLKRQLEDISTSRNEQKKKRQDVAVTAALVGYTNAGKSSLMNRLCKVHVLEENKLFATLDSTYRTLNPDTKPPMILIDTVGFIQNLPNTLIAGFRTTLESAIDADLLIIVCDASDPHYKKHLDVTDKVLNELHIKDKERLIVFNKKDLLNDPLKEKILLKQYPNSFVISSLNPQDIDALREHIINYFLAKQAPYDLFIPYAAGDATSKVLSQTNVLKSVNHETGIFYRIRAPDFIFNRLGLKKYILAPDDVKQYDK